MAMANPGNVLEWTIDRDTWLPLVGKCEIWLVNVAYQISNFQVPGHEMSHSLHLHPLLKAGHNRLYAARR
jgi:hypothetical protein